MDMKRHMLICFSVSIVVAGAGGTSSTQTDIAALLATKAALIDPQGVLANWSNATLDAPCSWRGVTCSSSGSRAIPGELGSLPYLQILSLNQNLLSGSIPSELGFLQRLTSLVLSFNNLTGKIPGTLSQCSQLQVLDLSANNLSGSIPLSLSTLQNLQVLDLSANHFSGMLPPELANCVSLQTLNLSGQRFSGSIPPAYATQLSNLESLSLSRNTLSGGIPLGFAAASGLEVLSLSDNALNGSIPADLASGLPARLSLDLSENQLTGPIPASLGVSKSLIAFNISYNHLQGSIPASLATQFNASSFAGNPSLCGPPLLNQVCNSTGGSSSNASAPTNQATPNQAHHHMKSRSLSKWAIIGIAVGGAGGIAALLLLTLCCLCLGPCLWWKKIQAKQYAGGPGSPDAKLVMFHDPITLANIQEATGQFSEDHVLSRTSHGIVFKAILQDGTVLSVRRLPDGAVQDDVFKAEAEMLGKVKHRNLTVLRGYYAHGDVRLLIYDYMPNGNLASLLQEASQQDAGHVLNWPMRHLIALGVARGLSFLHTQCDPPIVHGDVKPNNVQFDADFEAHLSGFGFERFSAGTPTTDPSTSSTPVGGSRGYASPEALNNSGQLTREADVYSFGIVLLELLTGRRPGMFTMHDEDIVKWVKRQLQAGQVSELFDPNLLHLDPESSEWEEFLLAIKVALLCTAPDPLDRPSMTEVVFMLEGCRVAPELPATSSSDPTANTSPV
ncbi:unnamed protein product [Sphagnum jensenii]|uniref:Protein kinase domain-containing protein n=1 Tax=Sphagnum jensenii TaxID=128206 RepID=A0ABP0WEE0_9BRYO